MNRSRIVQMCICSASHLVTSLTIQRYIRLKSERIVCCRMQCINIIFNIFDRDSTDTADCVGKIFINDCFIDTDCLKDF